MPLGLVVTGPELYSSCEMDTAPGQTAKPVNLSNTGGMPTMISPPTGTIKNSEAPPIIRTRSAPMHEPCQRFMKFSFALLNPLHRPRPQDERNGSIQGKGQTVIDSLAQLGASRFTQGHDIARRGSLSAQEGRPEVIKVLEMSQNINGTHLDLKKTGVLKQICQGLGIADRKTPSLIKITG